MDDRRAITALTEIRSLELEMAQRLDDARAEAKAAVMGARDDARRVVAAARVRGAEHAQLRHQRRLDDATAEAEQIRLDGEAAAAALLETLRPRLIALIDEMIEVVLATSTEGGQ